jgi:DNA-directed RNA polymerase subunit M/transcription elongation factor TFIIS
MADDAAFIARSAGKVLLEYNTQGRKTIKLWEEKHGGTLETTFNCDGAILAQKLLGGTTPEQRIKSTLGAASAPSALEKAYEEVKLNRQCPNCGEARLVRFADSIVSSKDLPVMPIYRCTACKKRSYYLTDEYLEFLVANNTTLFDPKERAELEKDRHAFMNELKEYIIRIFAAKHIARIR